MQYWGPRMTTHHTSQPQLVTNSLALLRSAWIFSEVPTCPSSSSGHWLSPRETRKTEALFDLLGGGPGLALGTGGQLARVPLSLISYTFPFHSRCRPPWFNCCFQLGVRNQYVSCQKWPIERIRLHIHNTLNSLEEKSFYEEGPALILMGFGITTRLTVPDLACGHEHIARATFLYRR